MYILFGGGVDGLHATVGVYIASVFIINIYEKVR